jgi:hypothetical protein
MPLIPLRSLQRAAGSRVYSVPHDTFPLQLPKLLCPLSLINVTGDTLIHPPRAALFQFQISIF